MRSIALLEAAPRVLRHGKRNKCALQRFAAPVQQNKLHHPLTKNHQKCTAIRSARETLYKLTQLLQSRKRSFSKHALPRQKRKSRFWDAPRLETQDNLLTQPVRTQIICCKHRAKFPAGKSEIPSPPQRALTRVTRRSYFPGTSSQAGSDPVATPRKSRCCFPE